MLFERIYGIDLGSGSVKLYSGIKNKIFQEKNMIAAKGHEIIAIGDEAYEMYEKQPRNVLVKSPMNSGMIADLELQEIVLYTMMRRQKSLLALGGTFYFAVPLGMTAIEKRAVFKTVNGHWMRKNRVYMVESPMADAVALGIDIENKLGSMIVNIGHSCTEFSIITDGRIIISRRIFKGGIDMDESICAEVRKRMHLQIGEKTGRRLKLSMGNLGEQQTTARRAIGIDSISGLPREEVIPSTVINAGIQNCASEIVAEMKTFLERIPPQIACNIEKEGIYLVGGSARIENIGKYFADSTGYSFNQSTLFERSTITGLEQIIKTHELRKLALPITQRKL